MFLPKFLVAGIASVAMLGFSAPDAKAQYVQYGYGNGYVQPYVGNVYGGSSYYSPYGGYQRVYSNNSYYNRGSYYNRPYYNQPYYGGRNYYNNRGYGNRGSGFSFNLRVR